MSAVPSKPKASNDESVRSLLITAREELERKSAGYLAEIETLRTALIKQSEAAESQLTALRQERAWRPMESARTHEGPFLVSFAPSRFGHKTPNVEMVGGYHEYEELLSYGEPVAYGWMPLPPALTKPLQSFE